MEHIEEGTIHAWLDGAVPADEASRIEAHVAFCAECAGAVAEARGLIAASSRILSALDEVPGGVIPVVVVTADSVTTAGTTSEASRAAAAGEAADAKRGAMAGSVKTASGAHAARTTRRHARRPWYRRPQWAAAAGIAFLAVAVTTVLQRSDSPNIVDSARESLESAPMAAEPRADVAADAVTRSPSAAAAATGRSDGAPAAPRQRALAESSAPAGGAATSNEMKKAAGAGSAAGKVQARPPAISKLTVSAAPSERRASGGNARDAALVAPVPAAPPPSLAASASTESRAKDAVDSIARSRPLSLAADAITRDESARVAGDARAQRKAAAPTLESVVVTGASSAVTRATVRASGARLEQAAAAPPLTPSALAGCYRVQPAELARTVGAGSLLQLEFAGAGSDEARPAYSARDLDAGSVQPTSATPVLRWTLSTSGEVVLVRGEGTMARRVTMRIAPTPGDTIVAGQLQGTRTACPAR